MAMVANNPITNIKYKFQMPKIIVKRRAPFMEIRNPANVRTNKIIVAFTGQSVHSGLRGSFEAQSNQKYAPHKPVNIQYAGRTNNSGSRLRASPVFGNFQKASNSNNIVAAPNQ